MGMLIFVALLLGVLWYLGKKRAAEAEEKKQREAEFIARVESIEKSLDANGLPVVDPGIRLQKGEVCHWYGAATWMEMRRVTRRVNYSGVSVSIPIMKGVRYRVGSVAPTVKSDEVLTPLDSGVLYVTSKRVMFDGAGKNTTITHDKLLKVTLLFDGVWLDKQTGKDPVLKIGDDAPLVAGILSRVA